ncbi:MAG: HAD hydrolase-like protein [Alphaproteobacteria bacterium]|nr:HAD hydrolase-like protein [Alphaproteobacteria bacterium]
MSALEKPRAIFFDWDGTLADSFSFLEAAHNHVLEQYGLPGFEKGGFAPYFGRPREEIYPALYHDKADEARGLFEVFVKENHKEMLEPIHGAFECLQTVQRLQIPAGVVSNKLPAFVNGEVDHFGWRPFFLTVVGAREAAEDKPSAAPLLLGLERAGLNVALESVWYVGDTVIDQKCAENAGARFIYIDHENKPLEKAPDVSVENCFALRDFLLQYAGN